MDRDFAGETPTVTKAPAIGMSVTCNAGGDRQLVLQTFVDQEADDSTVNALADRMMRVADRQQAIYKIPALEEEIEKHRKELANFEENFARLEGIHQQQVAELDVKIVTLSERVETERNEGYEEHVASGRKSEYQPKGARAQTIAVGEREIDKLKEQRQKIIDERTQNLDGIEKTRKVFGEQIAKRMAQIEECRAKIG